jgi:hypothetical protein
LARQQTEQSFLCLISPSWPLPLLLLWLLLWLLLLPVVLWTVLGVGEGGVLCEAEAAEVQHAISIYEYMRV